jgi:O-antigen/teichoic acid export membrane protein
MVHSKNDVEKTKNQVASSIRLITIVCIFVVLFAIYYYFFGIPFFEKYHVSYLFYGVCIIAIFAYINNLLMTIYRVRNSIFEIAFHQSIIPYLVFIVMFVATGERLLLFLLSAYIVGHFLTLFIYIKNGKIPMGGKVTGEGVRKIMEKGIYLFVYNLCFYLIIISTRTIVSVFYAVEEFGFFTFSYTLVSSILLLIEALGFIVFPKMIDKLNSTDTIVVKNTIQILRDNYIALSHGLMYVGLLVFPLLILFIPQYVSAIPALNAIALTILLHANSYGYNTFLMAKNKDRTIAKISVLSLSANIGIALLLVLVFNINYVHVVVATMLAYFIYSVLCVWEGKRILKQRLSFISIIKDAFPVSLLIPYVIALIAVFSEIRLLLCLPVIAFAVLNMSAISRIISTIKTLIRNPGVINIS